MRGLSDPRGDRAVPRSVGRGMGISTVFIPKTQLGQVCQGGCCTCTPSRETLPCRESTNAWGFDLDKLVGLGNQDSRAQHVAQLRRPSEPSLNSPSPSAPRPCNPLHARRNAIEAKLAGASEENQARTRGCFCRIGVLGDNGKFGWTNLENGLGLAFNVCEETQVTSPEQGAWPASDPRFSRSEVTAVVGHGQGVWEHAAQDLLRWRVKTASGFTVSSADPVRQGDHVVVKARLFVLHRHGDEVRLSVRSLTRAAPQPPWRALNPTASNRAACGAAALPPLAALI